MWAEMEAEGNGASGQLIFLLGRNVSSSDCAKWRFSYLKTSQEMEAPAQLYGQFGGQSLLYWAPLLGSFTGLCSRTSADPVDEAEGRFSLLQV